MVLIQEDNLNNPSIMSNSGVGNTITNPILIDFIPEKLAIKGTGFDARSRVIITPAQQSATTVNSTFLSHNIPAPDGTPVWKHVVSLKEIEFREGIYEINIDQDGVLSNSIWIQIELSVELNPTATLTTKTDSPQVAKTSILFEFSSNNVNGPEYQLRRRIVGTNTWIILKPFSPTSSYIWIPSEASIYEIELRVRGTEAGVSDVLATDSIEFIITGDDRTASIELSAEKIELGDSVNITASSSGFTRPQYQVSETVVGSAANIIDGEGSVIASWGFDSSVRWTPPAVGTYGVFITAREALERDITVDSEVVTLIVDETTKLNPTIRTVKTDDTTFEI